MGKTARGVKQSAGCGGLSQPSPPSGHRDRNSGERGRIAQMSSDAEDQLARMKLLVNCNARRIRAGCGRHVPCTMNGCGVLQGTGS